MADSFVPDSFRPDDEVAARKKASSPEDSFVPDSFVADQPAPDAIQKEIAESGISGRNLILSKEIKDTELQQIASKYGASPEKLRDVLPTMAGMPENLRPSDVIKGVAGFAGEAVTLGVPQKLMRMAQDPKTEAALDELKQLIDARKSYLQYAAEFAAPGVGVAKIAKAAGGGIKGAAATGAAFGAAGGFGASKAGEEVSSTAVGTVGGAVIGGAVGKLANTLSKRAGRKLTNEEAEVVSKLDIDKYEQQAIKELQGEGGKVTEQLIEGSMLPNKLNQEQIDEVLKVNYGNRVEQYYTVPSKDNILMDRIDPDLAKNISFEFAAKRVLLEDIVKDGRAAVLKQTTGQSLTDPQTITKEWQKLQAQGKEFVNEQTYLYLKETKTLKNLENSGIYDHIGESKIGQVLGKLSDTKMHLDTIDEKWGTNLSITLDKLSQNRYLMGAIREKDKQAIEAIDKLATDTGTRKAAKTGRIVDIIEGNATAATKGEADVARAVTDQFEKVYKFVTDGIQKAGLPPLNIPRLDKYVARMTKEVPDTIATLELELSKAVRQVNAALKTNYKDIADVPAEQFKKLEVQQLPSIRNLQEYTNWISNAEVKITDGSRLATNIRQSLRSEGTMRVLDKFARGSMERVAIDRPIPDFIREKDIYKILDRYSQDMLSSLYQRQSLSELRSTARVLEARGGFSEAKYINTLVDDVLGVRKGTIAHFMRDAKGQVARLLNPKIDDAINNGQETKAFVYTTLKEMVDFPSFLANQIYPNLLGWRATPILTNALSGVARAAPELGGTYGYTTYARGLVWARQNWSSAGKELIEKGYVPGQWTRTGQRALADGMRASGLVNMPVRALEKLNAVGMSLYTKSEDLNRISLLGMAKMMTHDLAQGVTGAQKALKRFPSSVQRAVSRAKNPQEVEDILMRHMNSKTAFNYNTPGLYEFGRTLGPMFATFAKWPTAIAGEIISEYRTKPMTAATKRVAERYAAPLLAFAAVDHMLQDRLEEDERLQKLVGKTGITKAAPITSVAGFTRGEIFTPPAVDTIMKDIITPITKAEGLALGKGLDRAAFVYAPAAGFLRFITEDVPTIVTGERPEGGTQTERSLRSLGVIE
jgi:hypothetical protein